MEASPQELACPLPRCGQQVEVRSVCKNGGYLTTVLYVSDISQVLLDLPPFGTPVSLQTPRNSRVTLTFGGDGQPRYSWLATVRFFGPTGVGLVLERQLPASDAAAV